MSDHMNYGTHADDEDWTSGDEHDQPVNDAAWATIVPPVETPHTEKETPVETDLPLCAKCKSESDILTDVRLPGGIFSRYRVMALCPDCLVEYAEALKDKNEH